MNILIISGVWGDTRRYRSLHLLEQCRLLGWQAKLVHAIDKNLLHLVERENFDIVVFQRVEMDRVINRLLSNLQKKDCVKLYDTDDLVFDESMMAYIDSPDFTDPVRERLYRKGMNRQKEMLQACDAAMVSTTPLAEEVAKLGKPVWVHPNAFSRNMLGLSQKVLDRGRSTPGRIVLGYASGTYTHQSDLAMIIEVLYNILDTYPQVELWLVGKVNKPLELDIFNSRVRHIPWVSWHHLPEILARFDINLVPLRSDNPFSRSKSAIKYIEAALVSVPTVASPIPSYSEVICDDKNGCLAGSPTLWQEKLSHLIENQDLRQSLGKMAREDVIEHDHPVVRCQQLFATMKEIVAQHAPNDTLTQPCKDEIEARAQELPITHEEGTSPGLIRRALSLLSRRGLIELLENAWVGIRRALAPIFPFKIEDK